MRNQLKTVAFAARSGPAKYASMVANVVNIPKPQEAFEEEIDNSRETPFVPRLREKPNAVTPLDLAPVSGWVDSVQSVVGVRRGRRKRRRTKKGCAALPVSESGWIQCSLWSV